MSTSDRRPHPLRYQARGPDRQAWPPYPRRLYPQDHRGRLRVLHIAIDDYTRISFAAILPDQNHGSALLFFAMARAFYSRFGFSIKRVLTDNGPCYRDHRFTHTLLQQRIKHRFTRPYTPRTNGKAERFIQTALREWAYARTYQNSAEREQHLAPFIHQYNWHRPHASLSLTHNQQNRSASEQPIEPPHLGQRSRYTYKEIPKR